MQGPDLRTDYKPYAPPLAGLIQPPVRGTGDANLAGRARRLGARVVDTLLFAVSGAPLAFAFVFGHHRAMVGMAATAIVLVAFTAYQSFLVTTTGQSVAKRWFGIRLVRLDGRRAGFVSGVVVREWLFAVVEVVPFVGMLLRLLDSAMIFGEERRCLHDQLAATKVVLASVPVLPG